MKNLLITVLVAGAAVIGTLVVEQTRINSMKKEWARESLQSEWQAAQLLIHFDQRRPYWFVDSSNGVEVAAMNRIRNLLVVSTMDGRILQQSKLYSRLELPPPQATGSAVRTWVGKGKYLFYTGPLHASDGNTYLLTVGKHL